MPTIRIFKQYVRLPYVMLAALDGLLLFACLYVGSLIRFGDLSAADVYMGDVLPRAVVFALFMLLGMSAMGLYQNQRAEKLSEFALRLGAAFAIGWLGLALLYYAYPTLYSGRSVLLLSVIAAVAAVSIVRPIYFRIMNVSGLKRRVLVLGAGHTASKLMAELGPKHKSGLRIMGYYPASDQKVSVPDSSVVHVPEGDLPAYCRDNRIEEIVLAADDRRNAFPMKELLQCKLQGASIVELMTFYEREQGRVRLDMLYPGWLVFCDGCARGALRQATKRAFDIAASTILLAAAFPFMLFTAILIKLEDGLRAPVFYRQRRVGEGGREFDVLKFRSMTVNAESEGGAQWAQKGDSRVTRIGSLIRPTRIDELPQIFNVLRGEMSFVGPRPERPEFVSSLAKEIPYYDERHSVRPGITGWAQIKYPYGASIDDARAKLEYDLYYVKNHNLMLDLYIMVTTAEVVVFGKGR